MAAERLDSRVEQTRKYTAGRSSGQPVPSRLRASDKEKRNSTLGRGDRPRTVGLDSDALSSGPKGMFEEPRSGNDRRIQLVPYMIPDSGCRRKRNRRSWRSHLNSGEWWMLRDYLRRE